MHKIFSFKGITRNGDNLLAAEGSCIEMMNVRMKDGAIVPFPRPKREALLSAYYSKIFWHEITAHYLCVTDDADATMHLYDSSWNRVKNTAGEPLFFAALKGVRDIQFHGNVACCVTDAGINYLLYNDGCYHFLGERPPMPEIEITYNSKLMKIVTETAFNVAASDDFESTWRYNAKGFFDEAISNLNASGCYIDRAFFKFALRAYDGSYISVSPALYVCDEGRINGVSRDEYNLRASQVSAESPSAFEVEVIGFKPEFNFSALALGEWKNIVVGIDVFTTGSIMGKKTDDLKWRKRSAGSSAIEYIDYEMYVSKNFEELSSDIADAAHYYRIAEYDIEGNLVEALENVSQTNLVLQRALENDDCSYTSIVPECAYMFNNRLHVGCLKEHLCKGYDAVFLKGAQGDRIVMPEMYVKTSVNTLSGTSTLVRKYNNIELMFNNGRFELPPILSYPDSRAFEMCVYLYVDTELFCKTFPLTPHRFLNQAQYLNAWSLGYSVSVKVSLSGAAELSTLRDEDVVTMFSHNEGTHKLVFSKSEAVWKYNGATFTAADALDIRLVKNRSELAEGDTILFTITKCNDNSCYKDIRNISFDGSWTLLGGNIDFSDVRPYELRHNVIKVSAADNPFSFPLQCTYTPSQGRVVAMASNTVALSQGQFGQHPLYVFCSDGIWAMSVDASGTSAYLASYPLSREVCVNKKSVCGIDAGVVFVSSQGVMLLSGGRMKKLSSSVEGDVELPQQIMTSDVVAKMSAMMLLGNVVSTDEFLTFIYGAETAYLPSHNEIVFANEKYEYSYVYSLPHDTWTHVDFTLKGFVRSYSSFLMFTKENFSTLIMSMGDAPSGENRVFVVTRPQLWGSKLPKRVMQLMLHAYARPVTAKTQWVPSLACYMLASNDGVHFKLIAGRETEYETSDIKFPYFPTQSYRYYLFVVCGEMSADSQITGIELHAQSAWANRIR